LQLRLSTSIEELAICDQQSDESDKQKNAHSAMRLALAILRLHHTLITLYSGTQMVEQVPILLWTSLAILYLPASKFPELYDQALKNCVTFFQEENFQWLKPNELHPLHGKLLTKVSPVYQGVLPALVQTIADENDQRAIMTLKVLIGTWWALPLHLVDKTPIVGMFYTVLYVLTWICTRDLEVKSAIGDRHGVGI
jgi:hypothetical protein